MKLKKIDKESQKGILPQLEAARIFSIRRTEKNTFSIAGRSSLKYCSELTKGQMIILGAEIIRMANEQHR